MLYYTQCYILNNKRVKNMHKKLDKYTKAWYTIHRKKEREDTHNGKEEQDGQDDRREQKETHD